jgi:hypothetical protein
VSPSDHIATLAKQLVRRGHSAADAVRLAKRVYQRDARGRFSGGSGSSVGRATSRRTAPSSSRTPASTRPTVPRRDSRLATSATSEHIRQFHRLSASVPRLKGPRAFERVQQQLGPQGIKQLMSPSNRSPDAKLFRRSAALQQRILGGAAHGTAAYVNGGRAALVRSVRGVPQRTARAAKTAPRAQCLGQPGTADMRWAHA